MRKFMTQVKREFWECRTSFIKTPMIAAGVLMGLLLLGIVPWHQKVAGFIKHQQSENPAAATLGSEVFSGLNNHQTITTDPGYLTYGLAAVYSIFAAILLLVLAFYFVDALYSDRRDQSILFWKSMPVSERSAILSKLATGLIGAPALYGIAALVTGTFFLFTFMIYAGAIWNIPVPSAGAMVLTLFKCSLGLLLGWCFMALWYLPLFCWLLLCSAFVRKTPFLMALGAPLALIVLEKWVLGSHHTFVILVKQIAAGIYNLELLLNTPQNLADQLTSTATAPQFWIGLAVSAGFLSACVWLRTNRWEL